MGLQNILTNLLPCSCSSGVKSPPARSPTKIICAKQENIEPLFIKSDECAGDALSFEAKAAQKNKDRMTFDMTSNGEKKRLKVAVSGSSNPSTPMKQKSANLGGVDEPIQEVEQENLEDMDHSYGPNNELILKVFGFPVSRQLQAKLWDERSQAVQVVQARVADAKLDESGIEDFFQACCSVAQVALTDKVMPVYLEGLDLAKLLLGTFCESQKIPQELSREGIHTLVPIIVAKTADHNARSIEGTQAALTFLARQPTVGCQSVTTHMLLPIACAKDVAAIRGRLKLISSFITEFGFSKTSGMSLSAVMAFVRPHLDVADEKVRRAAVEVTVQCYGLKGERTRKFCANLKPALLKLLEQRFCEIDGGSSLKPKKPPTRVSALPELKGSKNRTPSKGRPQAAPQSRDSARTSSSAGSIVSLGKHIGMPMEIGRRVPPSALRINNDSANEDHLDSLLDGDVDYHGIYDDATQNPNFVGSPTTADDRLFNLDDDDDLMKEIESYRS